MHVPHDFSSRCRKLGLDRRSETSPDPPHLADLRPALQLARRRIAVCVGLGVLLTAPWEGWIPALVFLGLGPVLLVTRLVDRSNHSGIMTFAVQLSTLTMILISVAATGGVGSPYLPWVVLSVIAAALHLRARVVAICTLITGCATAAVLLVFSRHALLDNPSHAIALAVLTASTLIIAQPVRDVEERLREDVVLDALTGLFNRHGLERRFAEIAVQARRLHAPVSVVLFDVDDFKSINDSHGHAAGDTVLLEIAEALRHSLRSFELLYRLGGDELLLVLPSTPRQRAEVIAEEARRAIQERRPAGLHVTVSLGVCTAVGTQIALTKMYASADRCLYEAKRSGRNAVAAVLLADREPALSTSAAS